MRAIAAESSASSSGTSARVKTASTGSVRPLEEVVDDLDLLRAGAEARERVDEPLQPVVGLDDLLRRRLADAVRLVVDDERPCRPRVEHVEEAVDEDAVVLEREVALLLDAREGSDAAARDRESQ